MAEQKKYTSKLAGSTILIIGGTSGLGFGLAEALLEHEIGNLFIASSNQSKIDASISNMRNSYPSSKTRVTGIICDLGEEKNLESNIRNLFSQIDKKIDHIVFTAGDALGFKPLSHVNMDFMKQCGMVRFFAPYFVAKYGASHMTPGPASSITFTGGSSSEKPHLYWSVICAYASGLGGMMRALALELKPLRVNLVSPGPVYTELWQASAGGDHEKMEEHMKQSAASTLTGRLGAVEDVVEGYLCLLKDRNITGTVISSNGGKFLL